MEGLLEFGPFFVKVDFFFFLSLNFSFFGLFLFSVPFFSFHSHFFILHCF